MIATAISLRDLRSEDWPEVARIYAEGIATGNATFETEVPSWESWDAAHLAEPRLVASCAEATEERAQSDLSQEADADEAAGWAVLAPVSSRCVYAGVAEVSVYVGEAARGQGVGKALLASLVRRSEDAGIWTLQAGIFPENSASLELHKRCGFRVVGIQERIAKHNGIWRDVVLLERRSRRVL